MKRESRQIKRQPQEIYTTAIADCIFPEDIMLCILARLPVISIVRFKSVCKPWLELFSTREFVKMHLSHLSSDPSKQSFISHRFGIPGRKPIFNFSIDSKKLVTTHDHIFRNGIDIEILGCCNGLFCINLGDSIVFWNPAMRLSKTVSFPSQEIDCGMSLGFGYDAEDDDYRVVRIVSDEKGVELYSANSDSWTTIEPDIQFRNDSKMMSNVIVNGNPYWRANGGIRKALVCFDVKKQVFRTVPNPSTKPDEKEILVDWNGSLGALVYTKKNKDRLESLDVWVFDDGEQIWRKKHTFGCIEDIYSLLQCAMNGSIIVVLVGGKWCLFPEPARFMLLFSGNFFSKYTFYEIYGYRESLEYIKGMEKCDCE